MTRLRLLEREDSPQDQTLGDQLSYIEAPGDTASSRPSPPPSNAMGGPPSSRPMLGEHATITCEPRLAPAPAQRDHEWLRARVPSTMRRRWDRPSERITPGKLYVLQGDGLMRTEPIVHEVALCLYDVDIRLGMIACITHADSRLYPTLAREEPMLFADLAIPALIQAYQARGGRIDRMVVRLVGGAHLEGDDEMFNRGRRNASMVLRLLHRNKLMVHDDALGGVGARHTILDTWTGKLVVAYEEGPGHLMRVPAAFRHDIMERGGART